MISTIGREQILAPGTSLFERLYIRLFGYPALGLRVRAKTIVPLICRLPAPRTILDAGCGKGVFTFAAARAFPEATVTGADVSASLVRRNNELSRSVGQENARFEARDLTTLDAVGVYDAIIATDVLEHVDDDAGLLRRFFAALQPGGHLVLHVPHLTRHVFLWSRENFMGIEGHVRPGYTLEHLDKLLQDAGFEVLEKFYNYNSIETLMNDISYLVTGGRERRKLLYAFVFPVLLLGAWLARNVRPRMGSGLVFLAQRGRPEVA